LRALLVDDSESARLVLKDMLITFGFEVYVAENAMEAMNLYHHLEEDNKKLSLIVVDWKMPGIDGIQFIKELKAEQASSVPTVIMVTAFGVDKIKEAKSQDLIDDFLVKPVNTSALFDAINNLLHLEIKQEVFHKAQSLPIELIREQLSDVRVLLVEDNDMNLELAIELLADVGMRIDTARDGQQAIDKVKENDYDVVLMDIQMPVMDGLTATMKIRQLPQFERLPILAMTAHAMVGEYEKSIAAGMNDHITKPIDPFVLYKALIQYTKGEVILEAMLKSAPDETAVVASTEIQIEGIDTAKGLQRVAGKTETYIKILRTFTNNYQNIRSSLQHLMSQDDVAGLSSLLHTLAGVSGNIGMEIVHRESLQLSTEFKQQKEQENNLISEEQQSRISMLADEAEKTIGILVDFFNTQIAEESSQKRLDDAGKNQLLLEMKDAIEQSDAVSIELAERILNEFELGNKEKENIQELVNLLNDFEFEEALRLLEDTINGGNQA
jgi:two-component system, sensor histidine kinase and response regulator